MSHISDNASRGHYSYGYVSHGYSGSLLSAPLDAITTNLLLACSTHRKLLSSYRGPLVRVRESGASGELDIYPLGDGTLNLAAIAAHCGANDGFLVTAYDQSGLGNDETNATAAQQPKIFDSATGQVAVGTVPAVAFDGTDDSLNTGDALGLTGNPALDVFEVFRRDQTATSDRVFDIGGPNGVFIQWQPGTGTIRVGSGTGQRNFSDAIDENTGLHAYHMRHAASGQIGSVALYLDDTALSESSSANPTTTPSLADTWCYWMRDANTPTATAVELIVFGAAAGNAVSAAAAAAIRANQVAVYG